MVDELLRRLLARFERHRPRPKSAGRSLDAETHDRPSRTPAPPPAPKPPLTDDPLPVPDLASSEPSFAPVGPNAPFTVRVRALVEVADRADEVAKACRVLEENGWSVREATPEERTGVVDDRAALVVDGQLYGARWRAERAAEATLARLAARHTLALVVRDAVLVTVEEEPRIDYRVVEAPVRSGRVRGVLSHVWVQCGGRSLHRLVKVPAGATREDIERELAARSLSDRRLDPGAYELVPTPPADAEEAARRTPRTLKGGRQVVAVAGMLAPAAGGCLTYGWGRPVALVLLAPAMVIGALAFASSDRSRPPAVRVVLSIVLSGAFVFFGRVLGDALFGEDGSTTAVGAVFIVFTAPGVYFALRGSWVARHATLLVTLAAPVAWAAIRWLGRFMQSAYLETFGIPSDAVRATADFWHYAAVAEPVLTALGSVLLCTAVYGWLRHVHVTVSSNRFFVLTMTVLVALLYALTAISVGLAEAETAAARAAVQASEGKDPAPYFGLEGALMCVRLVKNEPLAVENGPATTDRPVLSFGASGDWIWLWDPGRDDPRKAFAVPRSDVQLLAPTRTDADTMATC